MSIDVLVIQISQMGYGSISYKFKTSTVVFNTGVFFLSPEKDLESNQLQKTKLNCTIC